MISRRPERGRIGHLPRLDIGQERDLAYEDRLDQRPRKLVALLFRPCDLNIQTDVIQDVHEQHAGEDAVGSC